MLSASSSSLRVPVVTLVLIAVILLSATELTVTATSMSAEECAAFLCPQYTKTLTNYLSAECPYYSVDSSGIVIATSSSDSAIGGFKTFLQVTEDSNSTNISLGTTIALVVVSFVLSVMMGFAANKYL